MLSLTTRTQSFIRTVAVRGQSFKFGPAPVIIQRAYHENVVEHYENPRNVGSLDKNSNDVGTVSVIRLEIRIAKRNMFT